MEEEIMLYVFILVLALLGFFLPILGRAFGPVSDEHITVFHRREGLTQTEDSNRLVNAYLQRGRRYRAGWAVTSVVVSVVVYAAVTGRLGFSTNQLLAALSGYFIGAIQAETYNLRSRFRGAREASLEQRTVARYAKSNLHWYLRGLLALTFLVSISHALFGDTRTTDATVLAIASVVVIVGVEACQRAVAQRARPSLPADLQAADDAIRSVAIESLRTAGLALGVLLLAFESGRLTGEFDHYRFLFGAFAYAGFVWSSVLAIRARRFVWPRIPRSPKAERIG